MAFATRTSGPVLAITVILALSQGPLPQARQATASAWPQWGGPNRNFMVEMARGRTEESLVPRARRGALRHYRRGRTPLDDVPAARADVQGPTLVGTRLYARDRKNIASFELGSP
jgi:hypothetical protein